MTHVEVAPFAAVSADGSRVAVPIGSCVWAVDARRPSAAPQVVELGHDVTVVGLDESGTSLAAAGAGRLSLASLDGSGPPRSVVLDRGRRLTRLQLLPDSVVAVVDHGDDLALHAWLRPNLESDRRGPLWPGVEVDGLLAAGHRAALWGRAGHGLDFSSGSPWLRVCELADPISESWRGEGLERALEGIVNGVLYPLGDDGVGIYDLDTLVELAERGRGWVERGRRAWDGRNQWVSSADGSHVLELGSEGSEEHEVAFLRVTRLDDDAVVGYAGTEPILRPPAIAVSTAGSATVAQVGPDRVLHILTLVGWDLASSSVELG